MAIIIKGRMPTKCGECRFCNEFGDYPVCIAIPMKVEADEIFPKGCPILHEIPDEHGRLGDLDKLYKDANNLNYPTACDILEEICCAPTVLEASN